MRRMRPARFALRVATLAWLGSGSAWADTPPSLDLRRYDPPSDPRSALYAESSATPGHGNWDVGAWLSYARRPVSLEADGVRAGAPVSHQLSLDYFVAVGVGERLALRLALPTVPYQSSSLVEEKRLQLGSEPLPRTALGDAAFELKATLLPTEALGGFGLAALARVTAPTGDPSSYVSDAGATGSLRLLAELRLVAVDLLASAGAKVREPREYAGVELGHELPWGFAVTVHPRALGLDSQGRWTWTAEARGAVAITPDLFATPGSTALAGLSARYTVGEVSGIAGAELPLGGGLGVPVVRGVVGVAWSPRFFDEDGDGVEDSRDECPELAEDRDGFEDGDGCPDADNDDDGVPDDVDRCPEPEDEDDFEDEDGCKDPDNDGDGVLDAVDQCPNENGPDVPGKLRGCPVRDDDGDGIANDADRCARMPEDLDGFQDEDGCPDLDDDRDRVPDTEDACPRVAGDAREDAKLNGCPNPDRDGDTLDDADDKCPEEPEDFDGVDDGDGCVDAEADKPAPARAKPLVAVKRDKDRVLLELRLPIKFRGDELDPASDATVRAIASALAREPGWTAMVGAQPVGKGDDAEQRGLARSFALVTALRTLTHRDAASETIAWSAVEKLPGATRSGVGVMILAAAEPAAAAQPPQGQRPVLRTAPRRPLRVVPVPPKP